MRTLFLNAEGGQQLRQDLGREDIHAILKSGEGIVWVDFPPGDPDAHLALSDIFGFHTLAIDDCFNGSVDTPKIDDFGDYLFIIAQSIEYASTTERLDLREVCIFLGANYVVTTREQPVSAVDELFDRACLTPHFLNRGADFLMHTIIDSLVDLLLPAVEAMDEHIDELQRRILENPDRALLADVLLLKRNTARLRRSILPERDLVNRLSRGEFGDLIDREALIFYRDVYDHIVRVEEMLDGLRDLADGALNSYLSALNNRMSEVMKTLSVVAAIFLPLTLVASIFGTNLDYNPWGLPGFEGGFFLMIAFMLVLATAMILYFKHRGWF